MISVEDTQLINHFATAIFYKNKENRITFDFVTAYDFICKKKTPYFDLLNNKPIKKLPDTIFKVIALGVSTDLNIIKLYEEKDERILNKFYKDYFKNIESSIFTTLHNENQEIENKIIEWKNFSSEELLFFAKENYDLKLNKDVSKNKNINLLKKEFSFRLRDEYPQDLRRLLEIFNIKIEDVYNGEKKLVESCKEKWLCLLKNRVKFTNSLMKKESNDKDTKNEIKIIKKEIKDSINEFENTEFASPYHVSTFWPIILYPRPYFSPEIPTKNETNTQSLSNNI